ncbi:helix-turn-helix domain-containing protein [Thermomonospora echinospora]|nr:helix-turn-helix domain-containing protein [Thermomonospora echinospora]
MITYFSTAELHPEERLSRWIETVSRFHAPCRISSEHADDFHASLRVLDLNGVLISELEHPPVRFHRSTKLIQQKNPDTYCAIINGGGEISQNGRTATLGTSKIVIIDSSRPFHGCLSSRGGDTAVMVVQIPRTSLQLRSNDINRIVSVPFSARTGVAAVLWNHLVQLMRHAHEYTTVDELGLARVTVDLVEAACAHRLHVHMPQSLLSGKQALITEILGFIQQSLGNPELCPESIAAAHQISTRYLHKLFQEKGTTVASWIRHRRLEQCRHDLANPQLGTRPIYAIAMHWGFTDGAHFSRIFRATYGTPPKDYRNNMLKSAAHRMHADR